MNKKAIWIIIGLMGAAMIGSVLLQLRWISSSIRLNQQRFDTSIVDAINRVAMKLEKAEERKEYNDAITYNTNIQGKPSIWQKVGSKNTQGSLTDNIGIQLNQEPANSGILGNTMQSGDLLHQLDQYRQLKRYEKDFNQQPLVNRIDLPLLRQAVDEELDTRGIKINHEWGVFDSKEEVFVIVNGNYIVTEGQQNAYNYLLESEYKANLFQNDMVAPGQLMIYFPTKASLVWGSVWQTLLASILFTSIILFCFAYTIQVIFRQKKLSEMKTDFINNMTHEFKTPIATISLAADSITSPKVMSSTEKISRFAKIIKEENKRMNNQVEKVLQMARLDRQDNKIKVGIVDMHEVIQQAVGNTNLQIEKRNGTLKTHLEASHPEIEGDLTHLSNIIHNLLDNANKYSPEAPDISIYTRNVKTGLEVIIEDKGMGMSKEARKHIFDKFYRVHTGNRHDVKGFGLGLSYVKAMVNAHHGSIEVKSELGKGSSFILTFPFKQQ